MAWQNQGPNMDQFEAYFRIADLDGDGRISGAEAFGFFQGSNLSEQVLAQVWRYIADQNKTGFLGRTEFYNALKLVTVAQSKGELTPYMVKAALYGPAAAKIPAPQINLTATSAPQLNSMGAASAPRSATAPTSSQNLGFRAQGVPNPSMNQHYFPSQQNQALRPPQPMPAATAPRPSQGIPSPQLTRGGNMSSPDVPNSNISNDWLSGFDEARFSKLHRRTRVKRWIASIVCHQKHNTFGVDQVKGTSTSGTTAIAWGTSTATAVAIGNNKSNSDNTTIVGDNSGNLGNVGQIGQVGNIGNIGIGGKVNGGIGTGNSTKFG